MKPLFLRLSCFAAVAICLLTATEAATAQHSDALRPSVADRIDQMFKTSGLAYTRKSDVFISDINSRRFIFAVNEDLLVGFSVMAKKGGFQSSAAAFESFLAASNKYDYVKMELNENGDLAVRFDSSVRVLDQKEFENLVHQLINAEDDIRKDIQPYLLAPKP